MTGNDISINSRVADILRIFGYSAIVVLAAAVVFRLMDVPSMRFLVVLGAMLITLAPVAGVVSAGILSIRRGKRHIFIFALIIVAVYIAGYLLAG